MSFRDLRSRLPGNRVRSRDDGYQLATVLAIQPDLKTCDVQLQDGRVLTGIECSRLTRREVGDIVRIRRSEDDHAPMRAMITRLPTRTGYGVESSEPTEAQAGSEAEAEAQSESSAGPPGFIVVWRQGQGQIPQGQLRVVLQVDVAIRRCGEGRCLRARPL